MKKLNNKKIFAMLLLILACIPIIAWLGSSVQAQINPDTKDYGEAYITQYKKLVDTGLNTISVNSVFSTLNKLIGMLALSIYLSFSNMFNGITGAVTPTPDNVIFNRVAVLDVNFFNAYPQYSILSMTGEPNIVLKLYNSFSSIALTAFVLCAMIVGIKIVLSSLASEKAAAKNALKSWVVGIIILFLMRLIMAGMFELNEILVYNISQSASEVFFPVNVSNGGGEAISNITKWFGISMGDWIKSAMSLLTHSKVSTTSDGSGIYGYNGMLFMYALQACYTGDFLCAVLMFVLLGQSITLFIAYTKRLLYIIILGVTAPLVILLDTVNKILKGSSTILNSWFKEFTTTVFMQTFHAILLLVTMNVLSTLTNWETGVSSLMSGAVAIALTSGMIKFEKVYKKIFGLSDGMVGGLQGQAAKLMVGLNAAKTGIKAVADNGTKLKNAAAQRAKAKNERSQLIHERGRQNAYGALENLSLAAQLQNDPVQRQMFVNKANEMFASANRDGYQVPEELVRRFEDIAQSLKGAAPAVAAASTINFKNPAGVSDRYSDIVNYGAQNSTRYGNTSNVSNVYNSATNSSSNSTVGNSYISGSSSPDKALLDTNKNIEKEITKLRKQLSAMDRSTNSAAKTKREIARADREIRSANAEIISSAVATAMGPANLAAGVGMGLGFGDSLTDSLKGGYVTAALDSAAEHTGRAIGKAVNARFDAHSKTDDTY